MDKLTDKWDEVLKAFRKKRVMTLEGLTNLSSCSQRTVQRRLMQWKTYTSYNQNGRYYVLSYIPKFEENGLWKHKGILFSKNGNLRKTVVTLINNSMAGHTATEAGKLLGVELRTFLSQERNVSQLRREKLSGRFVYFASDEKIFIQQKKRRMEEDTRTKLTMLPTDMEAIIILVERIKQPDLSIELLCARLNQKGHQINSELIRNLFQCHGLLKKTSVTQG